MNCGDLVNRSLRRWGELIPRRADRKVGNPRKRYRRFAGQAKSDLKFLCGEGANPFTVIYIIDTHLWWWGGINVEASKEDEEKRRKLSSHVYWGRCVKALKEASDLLTLARSYKWIKMAAVLPPDYGKTALIPLSVHTFQADSSIKQLIHTIRALGLHEPGWELVRKPGGGIPHIRRTGKKGKRLGGRPKEVDWGMCAAVLQEYLRMTTGKPHRVSIARLLRSAGVKEFSFDIPPEGQRSRTENHTTAHSRRAVYDDTVRKRIARLCEDADTRRDIVGRAEWHHMVFGRDGMIPPPA